MVISTLRKKKASAFEAGIRKVFLGRALELQSQKSGGSRPEKNTGWTIPGRGSGREGCF